MHNCEKAVHAYKFTKVPKHGSPDADKDVCARACVRAYGYLYVFLFVCVYVYEWSGGSGYKQKYLLGTPLGLLLLLLP